VGTVFAAAVRADAQGGVEDPALVVRHQQSQSALLAESWLGSSDPRVRAWGAFLVLRDSQRQLLPRLTALLSEHRVETGPLAGAARDARHAMLAVLDAIIQLGGSLDIAPAVAARLYPEFPTQSLMLLSRRGLARPPAADGLLLDIFRAERTAPGAWLTAANILIANDVTGVAAAIVNGVSIDLRVRVVDEGTAAPQPPAGRGGSCGFGGAGPTPPGWPDVGNYHLTRTVASGLTGWSSGPVSRGVDPTFYLRVLSGPDPVVRADFVCDDMVWWHLPEGLDRVTERLLASLAREPVDAPSLKLHVTHTIVWRDNEQYARTLADRVQEERATVSAFLDKLVASGAMTPAERQAAAPVIAVAVADARAARAVDLPPASGLGPGVTVAFVRNQ
jgi:hypothetical protein